MNDRLRVLENVLIPFLKQALTEVEQERLLYLRLLEKYEREQEQLRRGNTISRGLINNPPLDWLFAGQLLGKLSELGHQRLSDLQKMTQEDFLNLPYAGKHKLEIAFYALEYRGWSFCKSLPMKRKFHAARRKPTINKKLTLP